MIRPTLDSPLVVVDRFLGTPSITGAPGGANAGGSVKRRQSWALSLKYVLRVLFASYQTL